MRNFYLLSVFLMVQLVPLDSLRAQINLARETGYYIRLIEVAEKVKGIYGRVKQVKSKTSFFRDASYRAVNNQPFNEQSGTIISGQASELITEIVLYADDFELPEFEAIGADLPPLNGSKQAISQLLTSLTQGAVYYKTKLKEYETAQKESIIVLKALREAKTETRNGEKILRDAIESGALAVLRQALFNDWYNFHVVFSNRLGTAISDLNTRKRRWERTLEERRREYRRYVSNVKLLLDLERQALQEQFDEAERKAKEIADRITELEATLANLEKLNVRLTQVNSEINYYQQQVSSLSASNRSYRSRVSSLQRDLDFIQGDGYKANFNQCRNNICPYGRCPNRTAYDKCEHDAQTSKFRNKRSSDARKVRKKISSFQRLINSNNQKINAHRNRISGLQRERERLQEQVADIPELERQLANAKTERDEFLDRLDIYYAFSLMSTNETNTELLDQL